MTDLTALTPPQIDELWNAAMAPAHRAAAKLADTRRTINRYRKHGYGTATRPIPEYLVERETDEQAELDEALKAAIPFDAEYERRGGWTRYLMVVSSSNGHVHRSPGHCGSLTPGKTLVTAVFELSGNDEPGVVERCGHTACSRCFKTAPVARGLTVKPGQCAGSARNVYDGGDYGSPANYESNRVYRSARCPDCGERVSVTSTGKLRGHKPPAK